jgi:hypothetical protein
LRAFFANSEIYHTGKIMRSDHFSYHIIWSDEDGEYVGLCSEFPSLSLLDRSPEGALAGVRRLVRGAVRDMGSAGEIVPSVNAAEKPLAVVFESLRGSITLPQKAKMKSLIREGRR